MSTQTIAKNIITQTQYATIATANTAGEPWNTPVFFAAKGFTIYWSSNPNSVHSKNIAHNNKAFLVIYNSKASAGEGLGLYIKAAVSMLTNEEEIKKALTLLGERRGYPFKYIEKFIGDGPQRIYKAEPLQLWTNDANQDEDGDFIEDFRVEINVA